MRLAFATVMGLSPIWSVVLLLGLSGWRDRVRRATVARQIRLTDAIAAELGAVVAPVVRKPWGRPWQVWIAVPFGRPATVARVLAIAHETLGRMAPGRHELVLTAQEPAAREAVVAVARSRLRAA